MGPIGPEQLELLALELGKIAAFDFVYSLASTKINQSAPNLVTMYRSLRSQMSSIMLVIGSEHLEIFALELGKIAELDFVYTLASTNVNQSVPNVVKINTTIRSQTSSVMDVIRPELFKLSALELENLPYLTLFTC